MIMMAMIIKSNGGNDEDVMMLMIGRIPIEIGQLRELRELRLTYNKLTGYLQ